MSKYVGDVPLSSIQEFLVEKSKDIDEIDVVEHDKNILVEGPDDIETFEITFTLTKQSHPEKLEIEEQRSEVKELVSNDAVENYFAYNDKEYFLSIEDVDISESSDNSTIREGSISGNLLSWPKYFPDGDRTKTKRNSGHININFDSIGQVFIILNLKPVELNYIMNMDGQLGLVDVFHGDINYVFDSYGESNLNNSITVHINNSFNLDGDVGIARDAYGSGGYGEGYYGGTFVYGGGNYGDYSYG